MLLWILPARPSYETHEKTCFKWKPVFWIQMKSSWFSLAPHRLAPRKLEVVFKYWNLQPTISRASLGRGSQKKLFFLGDHSQMWEGGVADSQTRSKLLKKNKSPRKSPFLTQISPFVFPNLAKTLGWVNRFGNGLPKKTFFLLLP